MLEDLFVEKKRTFTQSEYYDCVRDYLKSAKRWESKYMKYNTKTLDMMTNLKRGYYPVGNLFNRNDMDKPLDEKYKDVDFYVINNFYVLVSEDQLNAIINPSVARSYTATEFKRIGHIASKSLMSNSEDMIVELNNGQKVCLYTKPVRLYAQTEYDRDYRKEWINGVLEYEGNEYGDTSTFYFVGQLVW